MKADIYRTVLSSSDTELYKEKGSKFYSKVWPVNSEEQIKQILIDVRKEYNDARHWCYAYQIGTTSRQFRVNDDGEPSNSAGMPIFGQIQSFDLTNVLVVVIRYFGGVKLGVGGLVSAYKTSAKMALDNATIVELTVNTHFKIKYNYSEINKVMRIIKDHQATIVSHSNDLEQELEVSIRMSTASKFSDTIQQLHKVQITEITG